MCFVALYCNVSKVSIFCDYKSEFNTQVLWKWNVPFFYCIILYSCFYFFAFLHTWALVHHKVCFFSPGVEVVQHHVALLHCCAQWSRRHTQWRCVIALHARTNRDFPPDSTGITSEVFREVSLFCFHAPCHLLFCLSIFYVNCSNAGVHVLRTPARPRSLVIFFSTGQSYCFISINSWCCSCLAALQIPLLSHCPFFALRLFLLSLKSH